jgi:hypothetical protein
MKDSLQLAGPFNRARKAIETPLTAVGLVFVSLLIFAAQNRLTDIRSKHRAPPSMAFVPQSDKIKPYLLGFHTAYADYMWIRTTLYFGSEYLSGGQYKWLVHMVDLVTRLNPDFYPAYEFAGLMIPDVCNDPEAAKVILSRGISSGVTKKWKLWFYLGMIYYRYDDNKKEAAACLERAVEQPQAPGFRLAGIAAAMFRKAGAPQEGKEFLEFIYATSENPEVKRYVQGKLKAYELNE